MVGCSRGMASDIIPYIMRYTTSDGLTCNGQEWRTRKRGAYEGHGKPSKENLHKVVRKIEESTLPGGCNEHLSKTRPFIIVAAEILDQRSGALKATWVRS